MNQAVKALTPAEIVKRGVEIIVTESDALSRAAENLGSDFADAVSLIAQCQGNVVCTGMGKAGYIARKIAATFASTGTPSMFLHPAEAVHGDLGIVTERDIVLAISNSGETEELTRLLPLIKEIGAKLLALTGGRDSTLAKFSDFLIDCGVAEEACPLGLAPTASTTAALAVGDAMAMVVHEIKGFSEADYGFLHPGGSLGRRLTKVRNAMRSGEGNPMVHEDASVKEALKIVTQAKGGAVLVTDKSGRLTGIFTDGDLRRALLVNDNLLEVPVSEVMIVRPRTITADQLAVEAVRICRENKIGEIPVVDENGHPIGVFNSKDFPGW